MEMFLAEDIQICQEIIALDADNPTPIERLYEQVSEDDVFLYCIHDEMKQLIGYVILDAVEGDSAIVDRIFVKGEQRRMLRGTIMLQRALKVHNPREVSAIVPKGEMAFWVYNGFELHSHNKEGVFMIKRRSSRCKESVKNRI